MVIPEIDITENTDVLTGLMDLVSFRSQLEEQLTQDNQGEPLAVIHFNLENFKGYNERFGFDAGDDLLRLIARSLVHAFPRAFIARDNADHFEVCAPAANVRTGILQVRRAFRSRIKDSSFWLKAGYYVPDDPSIDAGVICDRAKLACDIIKGKRDVYLREYDNELRDQIAMHHYVTDHFDEALERGHIKVFYQPIVHIASGRVCDEEALARWHDPERGFIYPNEFVPVLEDARLIHRLDLYVVRRACEHIRRLQKRGIAQDTPPISINLSRLDFELCDIVTEVEKILVYYDMPRSAFSIEVTESALTGNSEFLKGEIDRFRADGFEVWMDDFGSGYSSLNLLKEYKFDLVKLDMGFLKDFETNEDARVLLANVVNLAKELGLMTLVEGVETKEQFEFLRGLGCGRAQGYLLGRPEDYEDMERSIAMGKYLPIEPADERPFYSAVAHVNLMRPMPHSPIDGHFVPSDTPAAILMRREGVFTYLNATDAYREFLQAIGADTLEKSVARVNDPMRVEYVRINECVDQAAASGGWEWTTYFERGKFCTLRLRVIAEDPAHDALAVLVIAAGLQETTMMTPGGIGMRH